MSMYKIYVGEYRTDCLPPLTYIMSCKRCELRKTLRYLTTMLKYGMDIYIKRPDGKIIPIHNRKEQIYGKKM